jgi:hypothetical protein
MSTTRPFSDGRPSSHHVVPDASHGMLSDRPEPATTSALTGDDHVP